MKTTKYLLLILSLGLFLSIGCDSGGGVQTPDAPTATDAQKDGETEVAPPIPDLPSDPSKAN